MWLRRVLLITKVKGYCIFWKILVHDTHQFLWETLFHCLFLKENLVWFSCLNFSLRHDRFIYIPPTKLVFWYTRKLSSVNFLIRNLTSVQIWFTPQLALIMRSDCFIKFSLSQLSQYFLSTFKNVSVYIWVCVKVEHCIITAF